MARRFGSAMISNTDSTLFIYSTTHMRVKAYKRGSGRRFQWACGDAAFAGAIQSAGLLFPRFGEKILYRSPAADTEANDSKAEGKIPRNSVPNALPQMATRSPAEGGASSRVAGPGSRI
jgi:hypothetical protein